MKISLVSIVTIFLVVIHAPANSQEKEYPEIGKEFPSFKLKDVRYFNKKELYVSDLKGKYVILDFFNKGCSACVASWPHSKQMQEMFKGKLQIFMIGVENNHREQIGLTKEMYEKYRTKLKLNFPVAFDTTTFKRFGINAGPFLVWIDASGIIKAITYGADLTEKNIQAFLEDKPFRFFDASPKNELAHILYTTPLKPLLVNGYGGSDTSFLYRSLISKWTPDLLTRWQDGFGPFVKGGWSEGKCQMIGSSLQSLYMNAFFGRFNIYYPDPDLPNKDDWMYGKVWPDPILMVRDSSDFLLDPTVYDGHLFNYSLILPVEKATESNLQNWLKSDLNNYFGYDVRIDERMMPCIILKAHNGAREKLRSRNSASSINIASQTKFIMNNKPLSYLLFFKLYKMPTPVFDETGINENVDINIDCLPLSEDFEGVNAELGKYNLELVKSERKMKVLVIRDPVSQNTLEN